MLKEIEELESALAKAKAKYKSSQKSTVIKPGFEAFEVYHEDLKGHYTWDEAKEACEALGEGWRLPTKEELNEMYKKRDVVGGFASNYYWSSTENDNNNAWKQNFNNGNQNNNNKNNNNNNVRAVRGFKQNYSRLKFSSGAFIKCYATIVISYFRNQKLKRRLFA